MKNVFLKVFAGIPLIFTVTFMIYFFGYIHISAASLVPLGVFLMMIIQYFVYNGKDASATGYYAVTPYSGLNETETHNKMKKIARTILWFVPFQLLLVVFANDIVKIIGSIVLALMPFVVSMILSLIMVNKKTKTQ